MKYEKKINGGSAREDNERLVVAACIAHAAAAATKISTTTMAMAVAVAATKIIIKVKKDDSYSYLKRELLGTVTMISK